jgi:hypothetical protein
MLTKEFSEKMNIMFGKKADAGKDSDVLEE